MSYFAEFLERGHRRNLIHLWVTIETIRQDSLLTREEELKSLSQRPLSGVDFVGGVFLQITVQEAVDIYETYFVSPAGSFHIDLTPNTRATLDSIMAKFLNRNQDLHYPPHQLQPPIYPSGILNEVDSSCFLVVQEEICDLMSRQDYPLFLKSTFYARFLQDKNGSNKHWQIMKSGKTESYPSQHHQSPPFQQDQVSPNRLSALSSASENLSTALPSSFVKNKPNMAELSSSSSSNLKHLVAPETTHVERTSFDADQSGAETVFIIIIIEP